MSEFGLRFEVNDEECKRVIDETIIAWLHETAGEIAALAARNTPTNTGQLKGSWDYMVNESNLEAIIGSPLENAIWNEFGTGEYAVEGDGRKGGWWIPVGTGKNEIPLNVALKYQWPKVRKKKGQIVAVYTYGKKPNRTLRGAYIYLGGKAIKRLGKEMRAAKTKWKPNRIVSEGELGNITSLIKSDTGKW